MEANKRTFLWLGLQATTRGRLSLVPLIVHLLLDLYLASLCKIGKLQYGNHDPTFTSCRLDQHVIFISIGPFSVRTFQAAIFCTTNADFWDSLDSLDWRRRAKSSVSQSASTKDESLNKLRDIWDCFLGKNRKTQYDCWYFVWSLEASQMLIPQCWTVTYLYTDWQQTHKWLYLIGLIQEEDSSFCMYILYIQCLQFTGTSKNDVCQCHFHVNRDT